jgi:hypothetical protein
MDVWVTKGVHGPFETHMIVDSPACKWVDLLRRHSRIL